MHVVWGCGLVNASTIECWRQLCSWFRAQKLSISKIFMIHDTQIPPCPRCLAPWCCQIPNKPLPFLRCIPNTFLIQWNSQTTTLTTLILLKGFCLLSNSGCIPWWENVGESQSTLIGALFLLGRCSVLPQDCLYLVFELCEGLDLLETIRRSKNGRRFARLGGIREMYQSNQWKI